MTATRYATSADLDSLGVTAGVISTIAPEEKELALDIASALCDGYLAQRYTMPLKTWCPDLKRAVLAIASYDLVSARGYDPAATDNGNVRQRYLDAVDWLKSVASGQLTPQIEDSSGEDDPDPSCPGIAVRSLPSRWFP